MLLFSLFEGHLRVDPVKIQISHAFEQNFMKIIGYY